MPTVTRKLTGGPTREALLDALRLQAEHRIVYFDVELPTHLPNDLDDGAERTREELLELQLSIASRFAIHFVGDGTCGIEPRDTQGDLWLVKARTEDPYADGRAVSVEALVNTKNPRASGGFVLDWNLSD
jgi:hypothetical protein